MRRSIVYVAFALLGCSCYRDINLDDYRGEASVVLNSIVTPDTVVMADIGKTWFFTEYEPAEDIKDLNVELYVNSQWRARMEYNGEKYVSDIYPREGDTVRIQAFVKGDGLVVAEDVVPALSRIKEVRVFHRKVPSGNPSIEIEGDVVNKRQDNEFSYKIYFQDEPDRKNYYFIRIEECDHRQVLGTLDYSLDPVFRILSEQISNGLTVQSLNGQSGLPFSDQGIDGREYALTIRETGPDSFYDYGDSCFRRIRLYAISEHYYLYLLSLQAALQDDSWQGGMADIGMAEPVAIYSNVQGGTGILGSQQQDCWLYDIRSALHRR